MLKVPHMMMATLITLLFTVALGASPTPSASADMERYGAPVTVQKAADIAKVEKAPHKFVGKTLRLEGTVKEVCQGRGCWIEVAGAKGGTFLAKSLDESVTVPKDCHGRKVVVQGVVTRLAPKDKHEHAEAESGHTCPQPTYLLSMLAVELAPAK